LKLGSIKDLSARISAALRPSLAAVLRFHLTLHLFFHLLYAWRSSGGTRFGAGLGITAGDRESQDEHQRRDQNSMERPRARDRNAILHRITPDNVFCGDPRNA
jgi:hypothetical protein